MTTQANGVSGSPKTTSAIVTRNVIDPIAFAALHSAREELKRADAASHRAMNCISKVERRNALRAATDHTNRALILMRGVHI